MKELHRDGETRPMGSEKFQRDQELQHLVSNSLPSPPGYGGLSLINSSHLTVLDPIYSAHLLAIAASNSGARFQIPLPIQMSVPSNASRIYTHGLPVNGHSATTIPTAQLEIFSSLFEQSANNNNTINNNKDEHNKNKVTSTTGKVKTTATLNNLQATHNNNKKRSNYAATVKDMANNKKNRKAASSENPVGKGTPAKKHPQGRKDAAEEEMKPSIIPIDKTSPPSKGVEEQAKSENGDASNKRSLAQQSNHQSRDKVFTCPICSRCFGYKHVLQNHERTHTGEKPYFCTICDKRFTRDHHLKTHMRLHTGEKPYNCTHCDRQFVQVANLRRHLRVHTGERPYSCDVCPSRFSDSNQLKAHLMIHKGQKPYFCEECCGRFRRRHHLTHHKCTKDNKGPFSPPDLSPPSSIKRERKSRETRRIIRVAGLPVATVTSALDPFIPVVPEQTHPEDLSLGSGPGLRSRNFSGSHSSVSASPSPNSGGSHGSIGPYWHSSSEPTEFYSDEERSGTADSSNGKHDSDEHPSPSQG